MRALPVLALLGALALPGAVLAQPGSGATPGVAPGQAPQPQPNRPQSDSRTGMSPQMAVNTLQDYAKLLQSAQDQLRAALERSGNEPANNSQNAVTPAWMDVKSASQAAFEAVRRAPEPIRSEAAYDEAESRIRQDLARITQSRGDRDTREQAERVLSGLDRWRQEVVRRAG